MVTKMMKWRPWPPMSSKKLAVKLLIKKIEGFEAIKEEIRVLMAEIRWKGAKLGLGLRKMIKNCTKEVEFDEKIGILEWNEEFESVCGLDFEIEIRVFNVLKQGIKKKASLIGTTSLNLADFASITNEDIDIGLLVSSPNVESHPSLNLTLHLVEPGINQDSCETIQKLPSPLSPFSGDSLLSEKDEHSALKTGLRKVKILKEFVSIKKAKKTSRDEGSSEGRYSSKSDDVDSPYPFDTDSLDDDSNEVDIEEEDSNIIKSCNYGPLATANYFGDSNGEQEDLIYYSHSKLDLECSHAYNMESSCNNQVMLQSSKRSILPWKKRKLSFRSPKVKGEPLLKKGNREEGGDDIDYDRRLLSSSDESISGLSHKLYGLSQPEFGDDYFAVGSWEVKEIVSRDNHMKLKTNVFFASIDQRSERAAGESACTALVAVIADWFQSNPNIMPLKSQFDNLIREGSFEWRNLCENQTLLEKFPDKHFDLETVLESKIRPLSVVSEKSFIGFFHPEGMENSSGFDFLHGAMSFDSIWDEMSKINDGTPQLYIVSWNDHFFALMVDMDAYYIIDTLGERLFEGCDQAYILKFDVSTMIHKIPEKSYKNSFSSKLENAENYFVAQEELVCNGRESCKEYIKSFLAAIPIRELQVDIKRGLMASTPLHHRLQIEFHYTKSLKEVISKECVQNEEQSLESVLIPSREEEINDDLDLRKEESVIPAFSLTPTVERCIDCL